MNFWNAIVESNTFNFAVLLLIFAMLYQKLNISNIIESLKENITKKIDDAKEQRLQAKQHLANMQASVVNLDNDIKERLENAKLRAKSLSEQITANTQEQIKMIEKNIENIIEGEEKTLSAKIKKEVLKSSIDLAKQNIIKALEDNPKLHDRFIEESIGEI